MPAVRPPQGVPAVPPAMPGADLRQRQMERINRPPSPSDDRP
jgi:predicted cobalt transporter CbtA